MHARRLGRRALLQGALSLVGLPALRLSAQGRTPRWTAWPFTLGVASGDPSADGMVLWTRLAPDPLNGGGMPPEPVEVGWEVADDDRFARIVQRGRATAWPQLAHAVHVELQGLPADRWFWYRFYTGSAVSPVGRTRTLAPAGASIDRFRFAFASCQHYETGYYTALRHMAGEDLDLVFHLGDYIYEDGGRLAQVRMHTGGEIHSVDDYRQRYALYKLDPDLQAAHAAFPWIVTTDDHEVDNDYAADVQERGADRETFLLRRAAAYRACYEHQPFRRSVLPAGPDMRLYRGFTHGSLASMFVLDTRQYRTPQPCGNGNRPPCPAAADAAATLLGPDQERWLFDELDRSTGRWNIIPQQVMMAEVDRAAGENLTLSMDQWPGYDASRRRLMEFFATRRPANPVVLTGDIHSNYVNDLKVDYRGDGSPTVATEFVGTSISSGGNGADLPAGMRHITAENPFVRFCNGQRGYVTCDITPSALHAEYRTLEYVTEPGAPVQTRARFVVEDGTPGAQGA